MKKVIIFSFILLLTVVVTGCSNSNVTGGNGGGDKVDCDIKGNISSSGEKIYHVRGCQSYSKTAIDEGVGERWFCSENEALNAGWRKAKNCY